MRNRRRRHSSYKFTEKTHSKRGMVATGLAAALLVLYIGFIHFAFRADGKLSMYYGSAGIGDHACDRCRQPEGRRFI